MRASQLLPALLLASTGLLVKGNIDLLSAHAVNAPTASSTTIHGPSSSTFVNGAGSLVEDAASQSKVGEADLRSSQAIHDSSAEALTRTLSTLVTGKDVLQKRDKKESAASSKKKTPAKKKTPNSNSSKKKHQGQSSAKQGDSGKHGATGKHGAAGKHGETGKHANAGDKGKKGKSKPPMSLKELQQMVLAAEKKIKVKSCSASRQKKGKKHARQFVGLKNLDRRSSPQPVVRSASGYDSEGEVLQGYTKTAGYGEALVTSAMLPCLGVAAIAGEGSKIVSHIQPDRVAEEFPAFTRALNELRERISKEMQDLDHKIEAESDANEKQRLRERQKQLTEPIRFAISLPTPTDAQAYTNNRQRQREYSEGTEKDIRDLKARTAHLKPQIIEREAARQIGHGKWEAQAAKLGWDEDGQLEECTEWIAPEELGLGEDEEGDPMDMS